MWIYLRYIDDHADQNISQEQKGKNLRKECKGDA